MFFASENFALKLLGVYHIHRKQRDVTNAPRNHITFSYRIRGSSTFVVGDQKFSADSGATVFLPEGVAFRNYNRGVEELIAVHMQSLGEPPRDLEVYQNTQNLEPLFWQLHRLWEKGSYNQCMSILYRIFCELEESAPEERTVPAVIAPGVKLLQDRFLEPGLSVADAAQACFVSQVYFRRIYRQHFGCTPLQNVLQMRFDHAMQLMRSGYYSTEEAARLSGFSDVKYFRTAFTKRYGCSPRQWLEDARRTV